MSVQFKKCKTCGRIFDGYGLECYECVEENERQFNLVKDYIWEHPKASMQEIVEDTGVNEKLIIRFLKEGRLEFDNASGLIVCEKCGAPITGGTLCRNCKEKLSKAMDSVLPGMPAPAASEQAPLTAGRKDKKLHVRVNGR
ncbi:MAG: flagellar protein [Clostridia bacterium]|nr:flagellar protein [Clostridia bacterium]